MENIGFQKGDVRVTFMGGKHHIAVHNGTQFKPESTYDSQGVNDYLYQYGYQIIQFIRDGGAYSGYYRRRTQA